MKLNTKEITTKDAEKIISDFNKPNIDSRTSFKTKSDPKDKVKSKKISKK